MRSEPYDVAIVGLGPTGAVAAALLAKAGHSVCVVDRGTGIYPRPRAIALDHEILRVFQQLGLADAVVRHAEPFTDSCFHGVDGQVIRRMTMSAPPYPQAWTPSMVFNQPAVEAVLRESLAASGRVEVVLGTAVEGLGQDQAGVSLALADGRQVAARYAIGCDGASSTVRTLVGGELDDLGFDEPWLVVDVQANARGLARLSGHSAQYCEPERPCSYIIGPGNHRRWEISLKAGEDPAEVVTDAGTWRLLSRWISPDEGTLWRQATYRFHALVAREWHHGRVFLAGDAAHQQPPFLGQGMCQGIRDAANLAWKLDAVLQGAAPSSLLETYGTERRAHVRELTTRLKGIGALICERDPARARARDARLLAEAGGQVRPMPRQDVLPRLVEGALSRHESTARGTLFPQPWSRPGQVAVRLDDWLGTGWRLIATGAAMEPEAQQRLAGLRSASLSEIDETEGVLAAWFARHACELALVRPDHYVFGTATDGESTRALLAEASSLYR